MFLSFVLLSFKFYFLGEICVLFLHSIQHDSDPAWHIQCKKALNKSCILIFYFYVKPFNCQFFFSRVFLCNLQLQVQKRCHFGKLK